MTQSFKQQSDQELFELLRSSINVMAQGLMIHDGTHILFANDNLPEMLEIPSELVDVGGSFADFLNFSFERGDEVDFEGADVEEILGWSAASRGDVEAFTLQRVLPSGRVVLASVQPLATGGQITTYTDVTKERLREKELVAARAEALKGDRVKSEFLANMSHEIRTPMNGVIGMAELLRRTDLDQKQMTFTDVIVKSGASLLTIINDILDFSKIDAGQVELHLEPFEPSALIEDVAALLSLDVMEKGLEMILRVDPSLPSCLIGDATRMRQIMTNLAGNAVKFTDKGQIFVNAERIDAKMDQSKVKLRISVADTGIGIPKDRLEQVFDKFSQVDSSSTRMHEGTGLGLSIASSLVALMGGSIWAESDVGVGSTFSFEADFPIHVEKTAAPSALFDVSGASVLIVDDNATNRSVLSEQICSWQFDCLTASSGVDALNVLRKANLNGTKVDCVVIDYLMPGMNGVETVQMIRSNPETGNLPAILLTSVDQELTDTALSSLGIQSCISKPVRSAILLKSLTEILQDQALHRMMTGLDGRPVRRGAAGSNSASSG